MSNQELVTATATRRRLGRIAIWYLLPVVVFGLVAYAGLTAERIGLELLGVPWLITGLAGMIGAAVIGIAALRARAAFADGHAGPASAPRLATMATIARLLMLAAAVAAAICGVSMAPHNAERGFVIGVNVGLAVALALFAMLAGDLGRTLRRAG